MEIDKKTSIFLIDDDPVTNMINEKVLALCELAVVMSFTRAEEALDFFRNSDITVNPDFSGLILLDLNMPVMDGWEFLGEFMHLNAASTGKIEVVVLTSSIDIDDFERSKRYDVVKGYLSKPLTKEKVGVLQ